MLPEIGQFALALALAIAVVQAAVPLVGAARNNVMWMRSARYSAFAQLLMVAIAYGCLTSAFISNDFSVQYVAGNSNSLLPLYYRITAVWGGHEGSLLLWVLMLAGWGVAVAVFSRHLPLDMSARVLGVLGLVSVGFLSFMIFTSNPFVRLFPVPMEGHDLNPMLQDPGMIYHPPLLYMGYVGFSVAFAFAIAALLSGRLDATWARWSRPWTTLAWVSLTCGIGLGSWWAYYELGWGGWWFWDPVENASFMPWLTGTALIHSLAVTEKRGTFRSWTVLLAIITFGLTLLGAFLVRSGVITSVHAFATDPERGVFILAFFAVTIGLSLALYAWRAPSVGLGGGFGAWSRETLLLVNNVLLVVAAAVVLLGTVYPLAMDALGAGKISVGPPYFDSVFAPLMLPLAALVAIGPLVRWKQDLPTRTWQQMRMTAIAALAAAAVWPLFYAHWSPYVSLALFTGLWIVLAIGLELRQRTGLRPASLARLRPSYVGMHAAHLGLALLVMGVAMVKAYEVERDVRLAPGESVEIAGYNFTFDGTYPLPGPNYMADRGTVHVTRGDDTIATLHPEKRTYASKRGMPMTKASLDRGLLRDLYVSLGDPLENGAWVIRVYYKPYIGWLWAGCIFMALGGLLAASDRRYRVRATEPAAVKGKVAMGRI
ncbi:MAG: heme lyase CcmF/NrfE family subunit [Thiohalomonadaceae bacterium]